MRKAVVIILTAVLFLAPGILSAQMHGAEKGQQMKSPQMHAHMGIMANMMDRMQQIMSKGQMTPEQQKNMSQIMQQMSRMMREMSSAHGGEMEQKHAGELQEMKKSLDTLEQHVGH